MRLVGVIELTKAWKLTSELVYILRPAIAIPTLVLLMDTSGVAIGKV